MLGHFKRSLVISILVIVGSFLLAAAAFYVVNGKLATESAAITKDRDTIDHSTRAAERLANLKTGLENAEGYERAINLLLPPQEGLLDLPRDIETIGRLHQVGALFTFSGQNNPATSAEGYLSFTITAAGSGANLLSFLKEVEVDHPRYTLSIDSFDLTGGDPESQQLLALGRVYFKP